MTCVHEKPRIGRDAANKLCVRAMKMSLFSNIFILFIKFFAWQKTGSVSYLSGLLEVFFDIIIAFINVFIMVFARKPASAYYRFGYGKLESLGALLQVGLVLYGSIWLALASYERFASPQPIKEHVLGIMLILLSTAVTILLVWIQNRTLQKTDSPLVSSDAVHARAHLILNLGILVALVTSYYGVWGFLDPLLGFVVAIYMFSASLHIGKDALKSILDAEAPEDVRKQIETIMMQHKDVHGFHKLRTRYAGVELFVQAHIEMKGGMLLKESHDVAHHVEQAIMEQFPRSQVVLHQDPVEEREDHVEDF